MITEWFETMHEVLDHIAAQYPNAGAEEKLELDGQLEAIKHIGSEWIEQWMQLEDKIRRFEQGVLKSGAAVDAGLSTSSELNHLALQSDSFQKGEGYFKLLMFREANEHFKQVVQQYPEFMMARVYLALGFVEIREYEEALRHLNLIIPLTEDPRLKAIAFHAMGCIEVHKNRIDKACEYFKRARKTDPSLSYYSLS